MSFFGAILVGIGAGVVPGMILGWVLAIFLPIDTERALLAVWIGGGVGSIVGALLMVRFLRIGRIPARPPFGGLK